MSTPERSLLSGRRAIVTGGASGIGRATATRLAAEGADVLVTDIDDAAGAAAAREIGGDYATLDVSDPSAWARAIERHGPFDIAFLNAGISTHRGLPTGGELPVAGLTDDTYRRIMGINVDGVVFGARAVLPGMVARGAGDIVVTASVAGLHPIAIDPIYGLTKHAVVGLVRSLAAALEQRAAPPDVCISAICPGYTDTNIVGEELRNAMSGLGVELMSADHVAGVVLCALCDRVPGAQWVIWPGVEPRVYEWNAAIQPEER